MDHTVAVLRSARARLRSLAAVPALLLLVAACSDDGRELAPIRPGQTTTSTPPTTVGIDPATTFALTTGAFVEGGELPVELTCDGIGTSPDLAWTAAPTGPELAIVVRDRDANGYVHWIVTGIDPTISAFGEAGVPEGAVEQVNAEGSIGYLPPCPPEGFGRHVYDFTLHVLGGPVTIDPGAPATEVAAQIEAASIARAAVSGWVDPDL